MVEENELAPGIIVYSYNDSRADEWLLTLKTYSEPLLKNGTVLRTGDSGYYSTVSLDHRKCKIFSGYDFPDCHAEDPLKILSDQVNNFIDENIAKFCGKYDAHQAVKNHDVIFLKYGPGDFFSYHNDDCPTYHRTVSSIVYFNDDYDGGQLCFKHFNIEYKPKQGDCVVFSSAFPYMHGVKPISKGIRYAAVNWYKYI
jgi:hypothetical protein